ncbi:MAG: substrate-binding domain-containing protein, partial [Rhizobiaceae bacterium]
VEHLIELGHRKIGYVDGPPHNVLSRERQAAVRNSLKDANIPLEEAWVVPGDFSLDAGVRAARLILELPDRPTAVCCANDETAFGLISEFHKSGFKVPEQLSVVGFDDIDICRRYIPPLTTIRQPRASLGTEVADLLVTRIGVDELHPEVQIKILPVELLIRESTAPPAH